MVYLVNTAIYSNVIYKTGMFNGKRNIAIPVRRGRSCVCAAPHTNIKGIGTYRIYTKHIFFETGIIGTDVPRINLPLHLFVQHGAEILATNVEGFT